MPGESPECPKYFKLALPRGVLIYPRTSDLIRRGDK
jgi:hypothetical protein